MSKVKKKVRLFTVDTDKCCGCFACEVACSAIHAEPKFSSTNPERARIRVIRDLRYGIFVPVYAGGYVSAECNGRQEYVINGKRFSECDFCNASCPSRELFKEPDSGLPLKCDACENEEKPACVQWCLKEALTYEEKEMEVEEENVLEMEVGMRALIDKFGKNVVADTFTRLTQKS